MLQRSAVLVCCLFALNGTHAAAQEGPSGLVTPVVFPQFKPDSPSCKAPPELQKVLAFAQDNEREFINNVGRGLKMAAADRGLEFQTGIANNDGAKMIEQVDKWRDGKVGAVVAAPVNPQSLSRSLQKMIWQGSYVGTVVPPPAVSILNAPQYLTGKVLGDAAAAYIKANFKQANVVLLTHDSLQFLAPRFVAMRDSLRDVPGMTIVADISPATVNKEGGAEMMRTILLANPKIDVVLGADTVVLGALQTLRAMGKDRPDQFLGGIDGEPEAVQEIKKGGGPYKTTVTLASSVFGYAMGQHAADWLEGKSIPQAMDILPKVLTAANTDQYEKDLSDPASVYRDAKRRDEYLKMYGNICYDTRDQYVNFAWSSERK